MPCIANPSPSLGQTSAALGDLVRAAELRGERADVHLYLGTALALSGVQDGARAALRRARELCPRLDETPPGRRAFELGLLRGAWDAAAP